MEYIPRLFKVYDYRTPKEFWELRIFEAINKPSVRETVWGTMNFQEFRKDGYEALSENGSIS
jgi:hypothetical protein